MSIIYRKAGSAHLVALTLSTLYVLTGIPLILLLIIKQMPIYITQVEWRYSENIYMFSGVEEEFVPGQHPLLPVVF